MEGHRRIRGTEVHLLLPTAVVDTFWIEPQRQGGIARQVRSHEDLRPSGT